MFGFLSSVAQMAKFVRNNDTATMTCEILFIMLELFVFDYARFLVELVDLVDLHFMLLRAVGTITITLTSATPDREFAHRRFLELHGNGLYSRKET